MAVSYSLDYDEIVLINDVNVAHGGVMAAYTDELILTNKKIICVSKGIFGGTKKTFIFPLDQIKVYNGVPQIRMGKLSNGLPCLEIYFLNSVEQFTFQELNKQAISTINNWINEVTKVFGVNSNLPIDNLKKTGEEDINDSVKGAFEEVGESFKDVGREVGEVYKEVGRMYAAAFGFKPKNKTDKTNKNAQIPNKTNDTIKCNSCGKELAINAKFCSGCGSRLVIDEPKQPKEKSNKCSGCGKEMPLGLKFCTSCGTQLGESLSPVPDEKVEESFKITPAPVSSAPISSVESKPQRTVEQQIELLEKLKQLVDAGILSKEEFELKKKEIIG